MVDIIGPNGPGPAMATPPDDAVTITLKYWWTRQGTFLFVESNPRDIHSDTLIDACTRAARWYERMNVAGQIAAQMAQQAQLARELAKIRDQRG